MLHRTALAALAVLVGWTGAAAGQDIEVAEEPTDGVRLPATGLAGDHDATSVSINPAGLYFLGGAELSVALDLADDDQTATTSGPGFGLYYGQVMGGGLLPRIGFGLGIEALRPARSRLDPDPGTPTRLTLASATPLGRTAAFGVSWHKFFDDEGRSLHDVSSWDIGLSARFGAYVAAGFVLRDLNAPTAGGTPVQRRYELELTGRPLATDRLELALGGRLGETRTDVDSWLRWSVKLTDGLYFKGDAITRALHLIETAPSGDTTDVDEREYQLTAGLEVSLGGLGVASYGSGVMGYDDEVRFGSGTFVARLSQRPVPSIFPEGKRLEKIELTGAMSAKRHTLAIAALRRLRRDRAVVGLLVKLDGVAVGWASAQELRNELVALRKAGKKVFAFMIAGNSRDYYIGSAANKVYVDPAGELRFAGLAATVLYFKGTLDKLGVSAEFEKIEEYKSAPEQFTMTGPSEPAHRMRNELYDSMLETIVRDIAASRGVSAETVRQWMDKGPYSAGDLEKSNVVDAVGTPKEISKLIAKEMGGHYPVGSRVRERPDRWAYPKIAIIHIEGDIVDGDSQQLPVIGRRSAGSKTIIEAIAAARSDPRVKAIILRVDSPGGSVVASEWIAREVFATRNVKPIICSMGDVAASGGYFVSAGCETIFADEMTITGSIGIFFGKFDVSGLASRMGLSWMTYKRGIRSDIASMWRPLTDDERVFFKERLRYYYDRFLQTVADGRKMKKDEVDEVGRGRVWTGAAAKPIKLIDRFGGIGDAISLAKQRVGMTDDDLFELELLPRSKQNLLQQLGGLQSEKSAAVSPLSFVPGASRLLQSLPVSLLLDPDHAQARLPYEIVWE